jgi:hypothetical protein
VHGLDPRRSLALGILVNTRGLTELVILGIGRQLGVLDAELFGLMVIMALVTTAAAGPLLDVFYPDRLVQRDLALAQRSATGAMTVVTDLPPPDPRTGPRTDPRPPPDWDALLAISRDLAASAAQGHVLLSRLLPLPAGVGVGSLALLASEVDDVARAGTAVAGAHVTASPNVVRAADPAAELRAQIDRVNADWLVTAADGAPAGVAADVVGVPPGPAPAPGPVLLAGRDPSAWEVAVRLAQARGVPLQVSAGGATRQLTDVARRYGLLVSPLADGTATVVVCDPHRTIPAPGTPGGGATHPPTTVIVTPGGPRRHHGLAERASRLVTPDPGQLIEERS